jgi:hypothetical protein
MIHRLSVLLTLAVLVVSADHALAQSGVPPPPAGQAGQSSPFPPADHMAPASPFPSTGVPPIAGAGGGSGPSGGAVGQSCVEEYKSLREEAEKRSKLIKAAGERHAAADEVCKLIASYGQAEIKLVEYVETNSARCGIPPQIADQLKSAHKNTEGLQKRVCAAQINDADPAIKGWRE